MSTAGLHSLHVSLSCNSSHISEFFSFLTASPFLENVQWLFVELSLQDLHGAREIGVPALTPPAGGV